MKILKPATYQLELNLTKEEISFLRSCIYDISLQQKVDDAINQAKVSPEWVEMTDCKAGTCNCPMH